MRITIMTPANEQWQCIVIISRCSLYYRLTSLCSR